MQVILGKIKKIINAVILGFYFLFLISASLHTHNINFSSFKEYKQQTSSAKLADAFLDAKANCTLSQFLQSQLSQCECGAGIYFFLPVHKNLRPVKFIADVSAPHLISLKLRAPPQLFL